MKQTCYNNDNFVCHLPAGEIGDLILRDLQDSFKLRGQYIRRFRRVEKGEIWGWAVYIRSDRGKSIGFRRLSKERLTMWE